MSSFDHVECNLGAHRYDHTCLIKLEGHRNCETRKQDLSNQEDLMNIDVNTIRLLGAAQLFVYCWCGQ